MNFFINASRSLWIFWTTFWEFLSPILRNPSKSLEIIPHEFIRQSFCNPCGHSYRNFSDNSFGNSEPEWLKNLRGISKNCFNIFLRHCRRNFRRNCITNALQNQSCESISWGNYFGNFFDFLAEISLHLKKKILWKLLSRFITGFLLKFISLEIHSRVHQAFALENPWVIPFALGINIY